jgi:hypothetical protein
MFSPLNLELFQILTLMHKIVHSNILRNWTVHSTGKSTNTRKTYNSKLCKNEYLKKKVKGGAFAKTICVILSHYSLLM